MVVMVLFCRCAVGVVIVMGWQLFFICGRIGALVCRCPRADVHIDADTSTLCTAMGVPPQLQMHPGTH